MKTSQKFVLSALILAAIFLAAFLFFSSGKEAQPREIALLVNGEPIYADQIEKEFQTVSPEYLNEVNRDDIIDFLVEKTILLQEARKVGIKATDAEVAALYESHPGPEKLMKEQNLTRQEFVDTLKEQAAIDKLLELKIRTSRVIKEEEVRQIYGLNYKPRNISFEDAEEEIVRFLIENRPEILRRAYIKSLKSKAEVQLLI